MPKRKRPKRIFVQILMGYDPTPKRLYARIPAVQRELIENNNNIDKKTANLIFAKAEKELEIKLNDIINANKRHNGYETNENNRSSFPKNTPFRRIKADVQNELGLWLAKQARSKLNKQNGIKGVWVKLSNSPNNSPNQK